MSLRKPGSSHHLVFSGHRGEDPELSAVLSDEAMLRAMLRFEAELAMVQQRLGVIPAPHGDVIARQALALVPDDERLYAQTEVDGVPVPELVDQLRQAVAREEPAAATSVHFGGTSQDVFDTALVLQLREALACLQLRLERVLRQLAGLAHEHRATVMMGRTRWQHAVPVTFGVQVCDWLSPLGRQVSRLRELRPRLLSLQLGGAAGTLQALGPLGFEVAEALAEELDLATGDVWQTQRDAYAELGSWLSITTGLLGKMGFDVLTLLQNDVGDLHLAGGGGSSAMPHKRNPVLAERLVANARTSASLLGALHGSLVHEHQRSGVAWQLEWHSLPEMLFQCGNSLLAAERLLDDLEVDVGAMRARVEEPPGLALAEAASCLLSTSRGRADAKAAVRAAAEQARRSGDHLLEVLARAEPETDWAPLREPQGWIGLAGERVDRALREAERHWGAASRDPQRSEERGRRTRPTSRNRG